MPDLSGRVALVTGSSRGIGRSIAKLFAENGVKVICASRTLEDLTAVVLEIESAGGEAMANQLDVSILQDFKECVRKGIDRFGTIDILVNNAGITRDKLLLRMSEKEWDDVLNTNLKGCFNGIKAVTPVMLKNRFGRIISISSVVGLSGNAGQANYASSKAGIIGLTKSTAKEFASRNITANVVAPGYIETGMTSHLSDKVKEELISQIPLARIGSTEDVANAVLFLSSDQAGYITGQTISVNGGLFM